MYTVTSRNKFTWMV